MTDKYAQLRAALDAGPTPGPWQAYEKCVFFGREGGFCLHDCPRPSENADYIAACHPEVIRALLAERDALREALYEAVTEEEAYQSSNGWLDQAKAALAQEQGGSDAQD